MRMPAPAPIPQTIPFAIPTNEDDEIVGEYIQILIEIKRIFDKFVLVA